jgi:acetyl-CoA carboxylase biotin carboxyl carrier protein
MSSSLILLAEAEVEHIILRSPEVGFFTRALAPGSWLSPGASAGALFRLGQRFELTVPAGVSGRVENERPEPILAPVDYGARLYRLMPLTTALASAPTLPVRDVKQAAAMAVCAPYSGRFWLRPAPGEPAFLEVGSVLHEGQTIGLIEVMKTFTQLAYRAEGKLPKRARVVQFLVPDGGEVRDGGALVELEPA